MRSLDFLTRQTILPFRRCKNIKTEHHVLEMLQYLGFWKDWNVGAADSCSMDFECGDFITLMQCDVQKSEMKEYTASRFGPVVSDDELRNRIEGQENRNTKYNTKWALNVF